MKLINELMRRRRARLNALRQRADLHDRLLRAAFERAFEAGHLDVVPLHPYMGQVSLPMWVRAWHCVPVTPAVLRDLRAEVARALGRPDWIKMD